MALLLRQNALFLHIPKTGGSFVSQVLSDLDAIKRPVGHLHADRESTRALVARAPVASLLLRTAKDRVPLSAKRRARTLTSASEKHPAASQNSLFTFCFVRDPLTWYESFWRYMVQRAGPQWGGERDLKGWHPCAPLASLGHSDFSYFMESVVEEEPGFVTQLYGRYTAAGLDFVGRQETLTDDLLEVLRRLDVSHDEEELRATAPVNTSTQLQLDWPQDLRSEVERLEYPARVRFGYLAS